MPHKTCINLLSHALTVISEHDDQVNGDFAVPTSCDQVPHHVTLIIGAFAL